MIEGVPPPSQSVVVPKVAPGAAAPRALDDGHGPCADALRRAIARLKAASQERLRAGRNLGPEHAEDARGARQARWSPEFFPMFFGTLLNAQGRQERLSIDAEYREVLPGFEHAIQDGLPRPTSGGQVMTLAAAGAAGVQGSDHEASDRAKPVDSVPVIAFHAARERHQSGKPNPVGDAPDSAQGSWMRLVRGLIGALAVVLMALYLATDLLRSSSAPDHASAQGETRKDTNRHHQP